MWFDLPTGLWSAVASAPKMMERPSNRAGLGRVRVGLMSEQQVWASVLSAAASRPVPDDGRVLRAAVQLGLGVALGAAGCSVTELTGSGYRTTVSANDLAVALDQVQYDAGSGPCLAAAAGGSVERLDDTVRQEEYPAFAAASAERGVHSSLSLALVGLRRPAALNLYGSTPAAFATDHSSAVADLLARCVARLLQDDAGPSPRTAGPQVQSRRRAFQRAEALVMASRGLSRPDAFAVLTELSVRQERSIFDVAEDLLRDAGKQDSP